jgi:membrane-bound serine protease (ClpP class)
LLYVLVLLLAAAARPQEARAPIVVLALDDAITPATADYLHRGIALADRERAQLLVLQMDTPGGLDTSMREMIKDILASPIPVATFVAPGGARAASAGTYLVYASHLAAMTPASNLGAATPVAIGVGGHAPSPAGAPASAASGASPAAADPMDTKRVADATAYIRSLAQLRGRNAEWAEKAVREAVSLPAAEALQLKVVDVIAADVPDLLRQLDGREVRVAGGAKQLHTRDARVVDFPQDWRTRLLGVIANPSLALMLLMLGMYALLFEFSMPGLVAPGVVGAICVLVALFSLQMLPVNYAGLGLVLVGVACFVAEAFVPSYGVLGLGGITAFALGAVILIDTDTPGWGVPFSLVATLALVSAAVVIGIAGMAARARRRPVVTGPGTLVSAQGELVEYAGGSGWALVRGEHWKVHGPADLHAGDKVRVTALHDGVLEVAAA